MRKEPLGILRSLIVISDWVSFAHPDKPTDMKWFYQNQEVESITKSSVIFLPVNSIRVDSN